MSPPFVLVREETGDVPTPTPPIDALAAFLGTASAGPFLSPTAFGRLKALAAIQGEGPGVRDCGHVLKKNQSPQIFCRLPSTTAGSFGTIDVSGVTGTASVSVDATSPPLNDYDPYLEIVNGGAVGTDGITFVFSTDDGRNTSGVYRLGVATFYVLAGTGVKFILDAPLAPLLVSANEIRGDFLAHVINVTGAVHGLADPTSYGIPAAATTLATAITLLNALRTALPLHRAHTAGGVHGAADTSPGSAITAPIATDSLSAVTLAADLKAKLNYHEGVTAGGVHGIADVLNLVTSATPAAGTLNAGDKVRVHANGPKWIADDLGDGFNALAETGLDFSMVYLSGSCTATEAAAVTSGLDTLRGVGKRCAAVIQAPAQNVGETELAWITRIGQDYQTYFDSRVSVCAGSAWVSIDDGLRTRRFSMSFAPAFMARTLSLDRFVSPSAVANGPLEGVALVDSANGRIGHDESWIGGLDEYRFVALCRLPDPQRRNGAYVSHPYVMRAPDDRVSQLQVRRVTNAAERVASSLSWDQIGNNEDYDPVLQLISETAALAIAAKIRGPLSAEFSRDIANPQDENLVQVNRSVTASGDDIFVEITINMRPWKYIGGITLVFSLKV